MKHFLKNKGKRITALVLTAVMCLAAFPMSAFAWTSEEGKACTSYFGEKYVGSDGEHYYSKSMVLGEWKTVSGRFGDENTVVPYENADLAAQLDEAISNIHAEITAYETEEELEEEDTSTLITG